MITLCTAICIGCCALQHKRGVVHRNISIVHCNILRGIVHCNILRVLCTATPYCALQHTRQYCALQHTLSIVQCNIMDPKKIFNPIRTSRKRSGFLYCIVRSTRKPQRVVFLYCIYKVYTQTPACSLYTALTPHIANAKRLPPNQGLIIKVQRDLLTY